MPDLVVAGAGMAGLVTAAAATELGADVLVLEKGPRIGGSMLLSSGVVWRHARFDDFRRECPDGDPELQRLVYDGLSDGLAWLETLGARVLSRGTGNPRTQGARFGTGSLAAALVRRIGRLRLNEPLHELPDGVPVVLATGGFQANRDLVRRHITPEAEALMLRATPWSTGDGLMLGLDAGGRATAGMDEFYGRNMPAVSTALDPADYVRLAQLYARRATVVAEDGQRFEARAWSEIDVVQWTARRPGARARYLVDRRVLDERPSGPRTVAEMIDAAERAGAPVRRENGTVSVDVVAGITTTLGGLAVDARARVVPGVFAAGADVGGIATGGYASGLAAALVLGRVAAASALDVAR